ncbi:MAG TPA: ribonuclease HIII [Candidatus Cloacimonetes bacterium]|nr:ribonuclease HIII [Candidatus Cloacimonadota bacterium]
MRTELSEFIVKLLGKTKKHDLVVSDEKVIAYGVQLKFRKENDEIPINIYYSKKKGISTVIGGSPRNPLKSLIQQILSKEVEASTKSHKWNIWAGTDESGKGDFFGPLVVCGFIASENILPKLKELGVKDSKLLKDQEAVRIAKTMHKIFPENIETIVLNPLKYNDLYEKFKQQNKKLNELLAWMHARVILNLKEKHHFEGVVIDKFASDKVLRSSLKDLKKINLIQKTKAEDDLAVAAASILARYHFLLKLDDFSKKYKIEFPKGASQKVIQAGKEFSQKFGKERLKEVAKIHFKTYQEIP